MLPDSAEQQIWALVSGLPAGPRGRRRFMTLQAFIDDSGSEPSHPIFYLAGFMAPHERWADFSNDWQKELDRQPTLEYFKMSEAARLREQFDKRRGWDEPLRDARVLAFANIVKKYAEARISSSIRHGDFSKHVKAQPALQRTFFSDHPYSMMFLQTVLATATFSPSIGINDPCDFIFDEQDGFAQEAIALWPSFKAMVERSEHSDVARRFGSQPITRDDKKFLPLQAGDLYAWHLRDYSIKTRWTEKPLGPVLSLLSPIPKIVRKFTRAEMKRLDRCLVDARKNLLPGTKLVHVGKTRGERKRLRRKTKTTA